MTELRVTTSWDDGDLAVPKLADRLHRSGVRATFYVPARNIEGRPVLAAPELREIAAAGFEIAAHGLNHRRLPALAEEDALAEVVDGRHRIEDALGGPVAGFAYPGGHPGRFGTQVVRRAGFTYARTTEMFRLDPGDDPFLVPTTLQVMPHTPVPLLRNLVRRGNFRRRWSVAALALRHAPDVEGGIGAVIAHARLHGGILHLWGHAWEIEALDLWPMLDRVFASLAAAVPQERRVTNRELLAA